MQSSIQKINWPNKLKTLCGTPGCHTFLREWTVDYYLSFFAFIYI
jgi:hypothetical protein